MISGAMVFIVWLACVGVMSWINWREYHREAARRREERHALEREAARRREERHALEQWFDFHHRRLLTLEIWLSDHHGKDALNKDTATAAQAIEEFRKGESK